MKLLAIEAICLIEKAFPTSIMDIQPHLIVHLAYEVAYAVTLHGKWMFFEGIERLCKAKS